MHPNIFIGSQTIKHKPRDNSLPIDDIFALNYISRKSCNQELIRILMPVFCIKHKTKRERFNQEGINIRIKENE